MGIFLDTRDPEGTKHEREKHTKLAAERQKSNLEDSKELKKIKAIKLQENLEELKKFEYIDFDMGVQIGGKTYFTLDELKEDLGFELAAKDENVGLTKNELKEKGFTIESEILQVGDRFI